MTSRDEYVASLKSAFFTLGKKAALEYIQAQLPFLLGKSSSKFLNFLGVGIANPLLGWLVGAAMEGIVKNAEMAAFFLYTDMRVGQQSKDFEAAAYANQRALQSGDPQEIARAKKNLEDAFYKFASYRH